MIKFYAPLLTILVLLGCAGATIEELEDQVAACKAEVTTNCTELNEKLGKRLDFQYKFEENKRRWRVCEVIYRAAGVSTISDHDHRRGFRHSSWEVKSDLLDNRCKTILKRTGMW